MSAAAAPLIDFVRDRDRLDVPPFRHTHNGHVADLACDMRQAAVADDARAVARHIRSTRRERLWRIESWLTATAYRHPHPRIEQWLNKQLIAFGWPAWRKAA
jgi:hypothetical protein